MGVFSNKQLGGGQMFCYKREREREEKGLTVSMLSQEKWYNSKKKTKIALGGTN